MAVSATRSSLKPATGSRSGIRSAGISKAPQQVFVDHFPFKHVGFNGGSRSLVSHAEGTGWIHSPQFLRKTPAGRADLQGVDSTSPL